MFKHEIMNCKHEILYDFIICYLLYILANLFFGELMGNVFKLNIEIRDYFLSSQPTRSIKKCLVKKRFRKVSYFYCGLILIIQILYVDDSWLDSHTEINRFRPLDGVYWLPE